MLLSGNSGRNICEMDQVQESKLISLTACMQTKISDRAILIRLRMGWLRKEIQGGSQRWKPPLWEPLYLLRRLPQMKPRNFFDSSKVNKKCE